MTMTNTFQNYKLTVKATIPGSLSSFIWAYCKTENMPESMERAFIRKVVTFAELSRFVRANITNDFDGWYRINEDSTTLHEVCALIINTKDGRTETYKTAPARVVSNQFHIPGFPLPMVLVSVNK